MPAILHHDAQLELKALISTLRNRLQILLNLCALLKPARPQQAELISRIHAQVSSIADSVTRYESLMRRNLDDLRCGLEFGGTGQLCQACAVSPEPTARESLDLKYPGARPPGDCLKEPG